MDIALTAVPGTTDYDWALNPSGTDLLADNGLDTAVLLSLFTDRLANPDDVIPDGTGDRRGTWMDVPVDGSAPQDFMGSRLWLLERAKATEQTRLSAIAYIQEALQWLIDDGVAASVTVDGVWNSPEFLALPIVITRLVSPGAAPITTKYNAVWSATTGVTLQI